MRNVGQVVKTLTALRPQQDDASAAVNGADIDRRNYRHAVFLIHTGALSGSPSAQTVTVNIQHASVTSTYSNVSGATGTITAANTDLEINVDCEALNQFVRVTETTAFTGGTTPKVFVGSTCVLGNRSGDYPV